MNTLSRATHIIETYKICHSDGSKTTLPKALYTAFKIKILVLDLLNIAHELWRQADELTRKHHCCKTFFEFKDKHCGGLTINSSLKHLVNYVNLSIPNVVGEDAASPCLGDSCLIQAAQPLTDSSIGEYLAKSHHLVDSVDTQQMDRTMQG